MQKSRKSRLSKLSVLALNSSPVPLSVPAPFSPSPGPCWLLLHRKILLRALRKILLNRPSPFVADDVKKLKLENSQHDKKKFKDASLGRPFGPPSRRFRKIDLIRHKTMVLLCYYSLGSVTSCLHSIATEIKRLYDLLLC